MSESRPVALVTGGARRVGRAIVERLAREGYDVAFTYLSSDTEAKALVASLKSAGARCKAIRADLAKPEKASAAIHRLVEETFDRLDVLVNSASLYEPSSLSDTGTEQVRRLNAIHFESPLLLCKQFEHRLRAAKGHVINMLDLLAERPWPAYLAYCASKAALWNLTLGLARTLAPEVTVNGIAPGVVEWPADYPEAEREKYLKRVPLGRAGSPEDVAGLVHYLCADGKYVTGQVLRLDGGRSIT
jgi:pteridine reductase